jgi:hypothetical protein
VELRGLEPRIEPAEMASELRGLLFRVVARPFCVLGICVSVLRDVTSLAVSSTGIMDSAKPQRTDG